MMIQPTKISARLIRSWKENSKKTKNLKLTKITIFNSQCRQEQNKSQNLQLVLTLISELLYSRPKDPIKRQSTELFITRQLILSCRARYSAAERLNSTRLGNYLASTRLNLHDCTKSTHTQNKTRTKIPHPGWNTRLHYRHTDVLRRAPMIQK